MAGHTIISNGTNEIYFNNIEKTYISCGVHARPFGYKLYLIVRISIKILFDDIHPVSF
jgi:hypothetical protein